VDVLAARVLLGGPADMSTALLAAGEPGGPCREVQRSRQDPVGWWRYSVRYQNRQEVPSRRLQFTLQELHPHHPQGSRSPGLHSLFKVPAVNDEERPRIEETRSDAQAPRRPRWVALALFCGAALVVLAVLFFARKTERFTISREVQYTTDQPLSYVVASSTAENGFALGYGAVARAYVGITNKDVAPGTFTVSFTFAALNHTYHDKDAIYVLPGETRMAHGLADISWGEDYNWSYDVVTSTKPVRATRTEVDTLYRAVPLYEWLLGGCR